MGLFFSYEFGRNTSFFVVSPAILPDSQVVVSGFFIAGLFLLVCCGFHLVVCVFTHSGAVTRPLLTNTVSVPAS